MNHDDLIKIESALNRHNELVIKAVLGTVEKLDTLVHGANPMKEMRNIRFFHGYLRQIVNFITEDTKAKSNYDFSPELEKLLVLAIRLIEKDNSRKDEERRRNQPPEQRERQYKKRSDELRKLKRNREDLHDDSDDSQQRENDSPSEDDNDITNLSRDTFGELLDDNDDSTSTAS